MVGKSGVGRPTTGFCAAPTDRATSSSTATARKSANSASVSRHPRRGPPPHHRPRSPASPSRRWRARTAPWSPWTRTPARSSPWCRALPSIPTSSLCALPAATGPAPGRGDPDHPLMNKAIQARLRSGLDLQDHHVAGRPSGERRAGHARDVQRRGGTSTTVSSPAITPPAWWTSTTPSRGPATPITTRSRRSCASTPSPGTDRSRPRAKDWNRSARRGHRHHALLRLEAEDAA